MAQHRLLNPRCMHAHLSSEIRLGSSNVKYLSDEVYKSISEHEVFSQEPEGTRTDI